MATCDPKTLPAQATCFRCAQPGTLDQIQAYLLGVLGGVSTPTALAAGSATYRPFTNKLALAVQVFLLAKISGQSTDPKTLEKAAACWFCIPVSERLNIETFLLASAAGTSTDPKVLSKLIGPYSPLIPILDQAKIFVYNKLAGSLSLNALTAGATCFMCFDERRLEEIYLFLLCAGVQVGGMTPVTPVAPGAVTNFTFVPTADSNSKQANWDAPPAGVTGTELWISFDGGAFVLSSTVAAPGNSKTLPSDVAGDRTAMKVRYCNAAGCGPFTSPITVYGDVSDWLFRIQVNGGAVVAQSTATAVNTFYDAIFSVGTIIGKVKALSVVPPDNLVAVKTPLIKAFGFDPWTQNGADGSFELTVNGIRATVVNGCYFTGVIPTAAFASDAVGGMSCYVFTTTAGDITTQDMGCQVALPGQVSVLLTNFFINPNQFALGDIYSSTSNFGFQPSPGTGFHSANVRAVNDCSYYTGSSGGFNAHAGTTGGTRPNIQIYAMGFNNGGVTSGTTTVRRYSFFAIHDGFTAAEAQALFNAVQALRVAFGGGFV